MYGQGPMFKDQVDDSDVLTESNSQDGTLSLEGALDFSSSSSPSPQGFGSSNSQRVLSTPKPTVRTEVKYLDKPQRNITEIRIFFDDQTWETFVPKK